MMFQESVLIAVTSMYIVSLLALSDKFGVKKRNTLFFLPLLVIFALGYYFRFSETPHLVDMGFFLTDSSYLFVYVLFSFFLMLGQMRYWKRK